MGLFDKLAGLATTLASFDVQLRGLHDDAARIRTELHDLQSDLSKVAERVTRLEAQREADRAEASARATEFESRIELRLIRVEQTRRDLKTPTPRKPKKK